MSKKLLMGLVSIAMVACVGSASAVMTNLGQDLPLVSHGHVLTPPAAPTECKILYAPSEADDPALRAAISAAGGGEIVDYFDARVATPDSATLSGYCCVYTWANYAYYNNVDFGNKLAAFVNNGGTVILGVFCTYTAGNYLSGAIMTPGYSPVYSPSGGNWFLFASYAGNGTTCIHYGVSTYGSTYRDDLALQGAGAVDGTYTDGVIAHAYRPDFKVIYSNGGGASVLGGTGDWAKLIANACSCSGPISTETTNWGSVKALFR